MKTVVVVGAGGTLAHAQKLRPVQTAMHPPLDKDFFPRASAIAKSDDAVDKQVVALTQAVSASGIFDSPWTQPPPPLEQFFADVYYEVTGQNQAAFQVFVELLHLYSLVIARTTNWMACRSTPGLVAKLIRAEMVASEQDTLTIVTFNQDLLIENELAQLPLRMGALNLPTLYGNLGLHPLGVNRLASDRKFDVEDPSAPTLPIRLLKLHGSLNWAIRTTTRNPRLGTLFPSPAEARARKVYLTPRREVRDGLSMNTGVPVGRSRWYLWPLVVPPIYDKQRITAMNTLAKAWDQARAALEVAERVVMIGYSMPEADILARQLLRRAFTANLELDSIDCINPDISLASKLKDTLPLRTIRLYANVDAYLGH